MPRTVWIRRISTSSTHRSISEQAEGERMLSLCFAVPNEDTNLTAVDLSSSIYAPLAGCDDGTFTDKVFSGNISIHAPLAGCDGKSRGLTPDTRRFQSTHPLRGATSRAPTRTMMPCYFNPRTPCGVRLQKGRDKICNTTFQSTHPLRGATRVCCCCCSLA